MQLSTFCTIITTLYFLWCSSSKPVTINNTLELLLSSNNTSSLTAIDPQHYRVQGTPLVLTALRPYGQIIPGYAALVCITGAVVDLAEKIIEFGPDTPLPNGYVFIASDVQVDIRVFAASHFPIGLIRAALQGVESLMEESGGTGERNIRVLVNHAQLGLIGRIVVSWIGPGNAPPSAKIEATPGASGVVQTSSRAMIRARAAPSPDIALATSSNSPLTPDHYRIPGTDVYVVIIRPYGAELPHDSTIRLILNAAHSVQHDRIVQGDVELPMEWRFEESGLFVSFNSRNINRPLLSTMQAGLIGLFDLMEEEFVVGTKELMFGMGIEYQGDCGSGQVNWIDPHRNGNVTVGAATRFGSNPSGKVPLYTDVVATS